MKDKEFESKHKYRQVCLTKNSYCDSDFPGLLYDSTSIVISPPSDRETEGVNTDVCLDSLGAYSILLCN